MGAPVRNGASACSGREPARTFLSCSSHLRPTATARLAPTLMPSGSATRIRSFKLYTFSPPTLPVRTAQREWDRSKSATGYDARPRTPA
jgi:hypothetical protein